MLFAGGSMRSVGDRMQHGLKSTPGEAKQDENRTTPGQGQAVMKLERPRNRRSVSRHQPEILLRVQLQAQRVRLLNTGKGHR